MTRMTRIRVGQGFDVHAFGHGDAITLGGVSIPHNSGLIAHSDGDVVLHALCDALLGSLALGDIGQIYPDSDPAYANVDSRRLLKEVYALVLKQHYSLQNVDITIIAQAPKMAPYIDSMRENIAADLNVDVDTISVKATTTETLGFTGRNEGIAVQSIVLVSSSNNS